MAPPDLRGGIPLRSFGRGGVDRRQRGNKRTRSNGGPLDVQGNVQGVDRDRSVMARCAVCMHSKFLDAGGSVLGGDGKLVTILDMLVMAKVLRSPARLVHTIGGHRRPAELGGDNYQKHVDEATDHYSTITWTVKA
jgi:hypothetical protein